MHNVISSSSLCAEGEIFLSERMTFFNAFILFSLTAVPENALGRRIFRGAVDSSFSKRGPSHLSCLFLGGFVMQMWLKLIRALGRGPESSTCPARAGSLSS